MRVVRSVVVHAMLLSILVCSVAYAGTGGVDARRVDGHLVLRNQHCRLSLDAATGEIESLAPGPSSLRGPWFEVVEEDRTGLQPWETWKHGRETIFASGPATASCEARGGVAAGTIVWSRPNGLRITGMVSLSAADLGPKFRLKVENTTGRSLVDTIRLPMLKGVTLGDASDDWFTWPHTLGARYRVQGFRPGDRMENPYPAFMYMQWLDLFDGNQGVYVGCLDDYGYSKSLFIGRDADGRSAFGVSLVGCWIAKKGDSWTTPWVQIAAHKGDWHAGADMYRPFAEKAFGPISVPEYIEDMPTAQCWLAHHADNGNIGDLFEIQQQAPIHASYLTKSVNTSTPEGWDGLHGSALDYQKAFDRIHELGGSAALFTFDRAPLMGKPNYADYIGRWTCQRRDGSIEEGFKDMMPSPFDESFRRARVGEAVRWVRDFGLDEIHYDTEGTCGDTGLVGTGMLAGPSYRMDMAQRPNEVPHYFKILYRETLAACRKYNPRFSLRAEHGADFFFPQFGTSTAHFFEAVNRIMVQNYPRDAQPLPILFPYTLPKHASLEMPSMSDDDFWPFGCGMGYGFHGGGPSWVFNAEVRNPEMPGGELQDRYRFYDKEWREYYDFRVGFREAVVDAKRVDIIAEALIDGKWSKCSFPGPLVAVTHSGGGREVTLGQWYHESRTAQFGQRLVQGRLSPRPLRLRVPTVLKHPQVRFYGEQSEIECRPVIRNGVVEVEVKDPRCFALEVYEGPAISLTPPPIAYPGTTAKVRLVVTQTRPVAGALDVELPRGWSGPGRVDVPAKTGVSLDLPVRIPSGAFGRNYPIKAAFRSNGLVRTVATHMRVVEPMTVLYSFNSLADGAAGPAFCVEPGRPARLSVTCVNNTPSPSTVAIRVDGEDLSGKTIDRVAGVPSADLGRLNSDLFLWTEGGPKQPTNALVKSFDYTCARVPSRPTKIEVLMDGKPVFSKSAFPRTMAMDLKGEWKVKLTPVSRANVGGVEGGDRLDAEAVTPDVWDGNWASYTTPVRLDANTRRDASWGTYRKLVYIPAEWQGTDIWFRAVRTGAPWGEGGTLNIVYVNGYPAGRVWINGECNVSPFLVFGGWNVLAIASMQPNCLVDPCLFVRSSPSVERIRPTDALPRPAGAFLQLDRRCTGQGITMPFILGVPEDGCRRTNVAMGGEYQFLYFAVADEFIREPTTPVEVEIEYLDQGTDKVGLDYDSTDKSAPIDGAFKSAESFARTNSGEWMIHVFRLTDARFANHEHQGSDFRVMAQGSDLRIRRVEVRPAR